jgi:hypothetical protein
MGLAPTRLAMCFYLFMVHRFNSCNGDDEYIMITDWPQDIGGKPSMGYIQKTCLRSLQCLK